MKVEPLTIEAADTRLADRFPSLLYDNDPSLWEYVWGDAPDEFRTTLSSAFNERRGAFSHSLGRVAQLDGEPVGISLCATTEQWKAEMGIMLDFLCQKLPAERFAVIGERIGHVANLVPAIPDDALFVAALSLLPAARGKGIGPALLADAAGIANSLGKSSLVLDVSSTNPAGRYDREGFRTQIETRVPDLDAQGIAPMYRMVKQIQ